MPLTVLANVSHSRTLGASVDDLGDRLQNDCNHTTRHAEPLKRWVAAIRAAYGRSGVLLEPKQHGVYSPDAQPDAVRTNAVRHGVHAIYEQKVACPVSTAASGTSPAGVRGAFANTESSLTDY